MQVEPRKYRFRVLNASISRSLRPRARHRRAADGHRHRRRPHAARRRPVGDCAHRHGRALRGRHRLREVQGRPARRPAQPQSPKNNIDFDNTDVVMAFDVGQRRSTTSANNEIPPDLNPNNEVMGAHRVATRCKTRAASTSSARTATGRSTARPGRTSSTATTSTCIANPGLERRRDLGAREHARAAGSTRCTSTSSTSRSSTATARRRSRYERGPKDVVYVGENETVRVIMKFEPARAAST